MESVVERRPAVFNSSAGIPSSPSLLLFFSFWIAESTSDLVDGGTSSFFWESYDVCSSVCSGALLASPFSSSEKSFSHLSSSIIGYLSVGLSDAELPFSRQFCHIRHLL
ncbi:hypothetical protein ACFFRR_004374 [Megaselia abdita]